MAYATSFSSTSGTTAPALFRQSMNLVLQRIAEHKEPRAVAQRAEQLLGSPPGRSRPEPQRHRGRGSSPLRRLTPAIRRQPAASTVSTTHSATAAAGAEHVPGLSADPAAGQPRDPHPHQGGSPQRTGRPEWR